MEMAEGERKTMIMEVLKQGQTLAKQLQNHLDDPSARSLIAEILSTYEKAMNVASSPPCDQPAASPETSLRRRPSTKRKSLPRWVKKVKVESKTEEESLKDGFSWRKYGQKDIHGASFPRAYMRCSHLHSHGCIATKQIQKSDEDPTIFHVIYRGHHTCTTFQDTPPVHEPIKPELFETEQVEAPPEAAQERFVFRCFSFSKAPLLEPDMANEWLISEALDDGGCGGVWTPESEISGQGDCPVFSMEELGIFDSDFTFDPQILS